MKVKVDQDKCIGCGACVAICPQVFEMRNGKSYVKVSNTDLECAKEAASACPVQAISVEA